MKANELRLGNIVQFWNFQEKPRYVTINARFFSSMAAGKPNDELDKSINEGFNNYWSGIPLTPEILEKCGFDMSPSNDKHDCAVAVLELGWLSIAMSVMGGVTLFDKQNLSTGTNIKYLHQLQNLCFALTGEELEVKL